MWSTADREGGRGRRELYSFNNTFGDHSPETLPHLKPDAVVWMVDLKIRELVPSSTAYHTPTGLQYNSYITVKRAAIHPFSEEGNAGKPNLKREKKTRTEWEFKACGIYGQNKHQVQPNFQPD